MTKSSYTNTGKSKPEYFYRVREFVATFEVDKGKNRHFDGEKTFKGESLRLCKAEAEHYYYKRLGELESGKFSLPFSESEDFAFGEQPAFSITLSLVEQYNSKEYKEHVLIGRDEATTAGSKEIEASILNSNPRFKSSPEPL